MLEAGPCFLKFKRLHISSVSIAITKGTRSSKIERNYFKKGNKENKFQMAINIYISVPLRDIPNFSAALGKSPRSTIPKDKILLEYLS